MFGKLLVHDTCHVITILLRCICKVKNKKTMHIFLQMANNYDGTYLIIILWLIYKTYVTNKEKQSFLHMVALEFRDQCSA